MARFTNFPGGITSLGIPTFGTTGLPPFTGNYWWVQETGTVGASGGAGTSSKPFNSLQEAHDAATNNNNDVVLLVGTVHQTAALTWTKNLTHLYGVCAPLKRGKRARISVTGATPFSFLANVSGSGCLFQNFGTFYGFPTVGATTPICWQDTGGRNNYNLVEFLGFGDGTATTGTSNLTGARAFKFNSNNGESIWNNCVFGVDTETRNATNYTLEIAGNAPRLSLVDCVFEAYLGASGGASSHLLIGAAGIDRYIDFVRCRFHNALNAGATVMEQAFNLNAAMGGTVFLDQCTFDKSGITAIQTTPTTQLQMNMVASTTTGGLTHEVF